MRLVPALVWRHEDDPAGTLDARLLPLLRAIAAASSLAAAVVACGVSYRAAWGLLRDYQRRLGEPLVVLERGRGARLTAPAERLLAADAAAMRRLARVLPTLALEIGLRARPDAAVGRGPLRVAASHDLALAALANEPPAGSGLRLDVAFMGSLHALEAFAAGRVEVAGFHVPLDLRSQAERDDFLRGLRVRRDHLLRFVDRDQGLMLPAGNPAHVRHFRDIAAHGLRFINRQRGSGTRLLIDQMLAREAVDPHAVVGYGTEEFTHPAVAATVASGRADVAFGLRAAAAAQRLAFVPLVRERYLLAVRRKDVADPAVIRLARVLASAAFARMVGRLPGYRVAGAGTGVELDAIRAGLEA